ncbi:DUF4334 domain-containing protein [Geodermatophilus sp. URMC 64]
MDDAAAERWLRHHRSGSKPADALAFFDGRPPVDAAAMTGRWRGTGLPTGHPFDGLLEAHGWYGKQVVDAETVHPLLFREGAGEPRPVDPAYLPLGLLRRFPWVARTSVARLGFAGVKPLRRTGAPAARLRMLAHRGVVSAAVVYDRLPVIDVFRRVAAGTLLGLMDMRDVDEPFFFVLEREDT